MKKLTVIITMMALVAVGLFVLLDNRPAEATALSDDRITTYSEGDYLRIPVAASQTIYNGGMVSINSSGYAIPAADTASTSFMGVSTEQVDNSDGSNGDEYVIVRRTGVFKLISAGLSQSDVGSIVYVSDDQTFSTSTSNDIICGRLVKYVSATSGWVQIDSAVVTPASIAASAVSVADSGTVYTATEVESALNEVKDIADANKTDLTTSQAFISIPLAGLRELSSGDFINAAGNGGLLSSDSTPTLNTTDSDTDGSWEVNWAATNQDPIGFQITLPPDLDTGGDLVLHAYGAIGAANGNTLTVATDCYFNVGDTKVEDATGTISGETVAEYTVTIAAADIPSGALTLSCELTPGTHANDPLVLYALWAEYTRSQLGS